MDLSDLLGALPDPTQQTLYQSLQHGSYRLQTLRPPHYCHHCDLHYETQWFHKTPQDRCFFCVRFRSPKVTRYALLYETPWFFLQSGQDHALTFYETYFYLLHRWADRFNLHHTEKEREYQAYLLREIA